MAPPASEAPIFILTLAHRIALKSGKRMNSKGPNANFHLRVVKWEKGLSANSASALRNHFNALEKVRVPNRNGCPSSPRGRKNLGKQTFTRGEFYRVRPISNPKSTSEGLLRALERKNVRLIRLTLVRLLASGSRPPTLIYYLPVVGGFMNFLKRIGLFSEVIRPWLRLTGQNAEANPAERWPAWHIRFAPFASQILTLSSPRASP